MNFALKKEESDLVMLIARRADELARKNGSIYSRIDAAMNVTACHANGCPLDLKRLLASSDDNFGHDVFGIRTHLDITTGDLSEQFHPRNSLPTEHDPKALEQAKAAIAGNPSERRTT